MNRKGATKIIKKIKWNLTDSIIDHNFELK